MPRPTVAPPASLPPAPQPGETICVDLRQRAEYKAAHGLTLVALHWRGPVPEATVTVTQKREN